MTTAEDLFQKFEQSQLFSKIDLRNSIASEDIHKTAFVTRDGRYKFLWMLFDVKNSAVKLVCGMRKFFRRHDHVESFIDGLIVCTKDWDTHLQVLIELLRQFVAGAFDSLANEVLIWLEIRRVFRPFDWRQLQYNQRGDP